MDAVSTERIRDVALLGHGGVGKTTLVEALLHRAGVIGRMGRVEDGTTTCDTEPEAQRRCMSLGTAVAPFDWTVDGVTHRVNLIDTPGHDDFVAAATSALDVVDLAVLVVSATDGVEPGTERAWAACEAAGVPRLVFVTKEDKQNADFHAVLDQLRDRFGAAVHALELPIGEESAFHGVADLLTDTDTAYDDDGTTHPIEPPADLAEEQHELHDALVEDVVTDDDDQLERYLAGDVPAPPELERTLAHEVLTGAIVPVLVGSAVTGVGVDKLADAIVHLGPPPRPARILVGGQETEVPADPAGEPLVHVFRTIAEEFVGQISLLKVLSGTLRPDDRLTNAATGAEERLHGLFRLRGKEHLVASAAPAGDLVAVAKLTGSPAGTLLARPGRPVALPGAPPPPPAYTIAVRAASPSDEDKLSDALRRLVAEDTALRVETQPETGQVLLHGSGDTHVQVAIERLSRKFGVAVEPEEVRIPYRETIKAPASAEGKLKKQSGGHGQFAVAQLRVFPAPRGSGFTFVDKIVGGAIPRNYLPAVEKGIEEAMRAGGPHGHPVVDVQVECVDGKYHSVDSSDMAFRTAAALGLKEALAAAGTVVLEPISALVVRVPEGHQGDVLADLAARRGRVQRTDMLDDGTHEIEALVPASELRRYVIDLRSLTGGRGTFTVTHDHYDVLPDHLLPA